MLIILGLIFSSGYLVIQRNSNDTSGIDNEQKMNTEENPEESQEIPPEHQTQDTILENHNEDLTVEEDPQIIETPDLLFSVSPIEINFISSIIPLGALSPPSHVFPTDHIYFMINRTKGADRPIKVPVYNQGDLIVTSIRVTEHVKAGMADYVIFLEPLECPDISIMFIHISSLNEDLFGDISDYSNWVFDSEYSTGDEIYRAWSKRCNLEVKAGDILGEAGGNPGQWALDLGVYDERYIPDQVANFDRWRNVRYLHSVCPLNYYEGGELRNAIFSLVQGRDPTGIQTECGSVLQDIPGTAQGCWFREGIMDTYPEDPHLALVYSNVNSSLRVISVGTSVLGLHSGRYEFIPDSLGVINREFKDVTPDGNTYGYIVEGFEGVIIVKMHDPLTLWVEAIEGSFEQINWSFSENKSIFVR
jgi:hypothetical protein